MDSVPPIAAIVLAAGLSRRMGSAKLLLPLGGRPLLSYAVSAACDSTADAVYVVVGDEADRLTSALAAGRFEPVRNSHPNEGMASSLRTGISAVPQGYTGVLILLGDQPLVRVADVDRVLAQARQHPDHIVAAYYGKTRGHPVYLPRSLFNEVAAISGDQGARVVFARHPDRIVRVAMPHADTALDVDDAASYERAQELLARQISTENG